MLSDTQAYRFPRQTFALHRLDPVDVRFPSKSLQVNVTQLHSRSGRHGGFPTFLKCRPTSATTGVALKHRADVRTNLEYGDTSLEPESTIRRIAALWIRVTCRVGAAWTANSRCGAFRARLRILEVEIKLAEADRKSRG